MPMFAFHLLISLLPLILFTDTIAVPTTIHIDSEDQAIIEETVYIIKQRLTYAGYDPEIVQDSAANIFTINSNIDTTSRIDSITYYSQFENNTLAFEFALRQDDKIIRALYDDVKAVDGLIIPEDYDPAAIFLSRDPQLLDEQLAALIERLNGFSNSKYEALQFAWTDKPRRIRLPKTEPILAHILYAYNIDQSHNLTESDIQSAEVVRTNYGDEVFLKFTESTASTWEDMTHAASIDNARPIATLLNDEVIYAPKTRATIIDGKSKISGNFNRPEANDIANRIRIGRLPVDVSIR